MNTDFFYNELQRLCEEALLKQLNVLRPSNGTSKQAIIDGKEYLLFCSNDYLGLSNHPSVINKVKMVSDNYGIGSGASRLISGTTDWHTRLEEYLAVSKQQESALCFSSGFLTNLGVITAFTDKDSLVIADKLNHASIIDACKLSSAKLRVYPHKNLKKLESLLKKSSQYSRTLIVTDSVFSMDGDCAPLKEIVELKKKYNAFLMIDEAHAIGCFGKTGSGLAEEFGCLKDIDLNVGTFSKSLGVLGGYVASSKVLVDYLKNKSRSFIYTTSLPACLCAGVFEALRIVNEGSLRNRLWENTDYFKKKLRSFSIDCGNSCSPIIPIIIGDTKKTLRLAQFLFANGIFVPAVRYPTVEKSKARLRVSVSAEHTRVDIDKLVEVLQRGLYG